MRRPNVGRPYRQPFRIPPAFRKIGQDDIGGGVELSASGGNSEP
ncbi:MAG: hypothetical protein AAGI68_11795 [Planctomycetota bacterium]